ncbi:entry exclusion lipoprotein TrbK [Stutzerimonas chloritidismutans]
MKKVMLLAGLAAAMLSGCDNKTAIPPMPEVNDTNCQVQAIKMIKDNATRETFAGLCSRRTPAGGGIAPTEKPLNWLELTDPKHTNKQEATL